MSSRPSTWTRMRRLWVVVACGLSLMDCDFVLESSARASEESYEIFIEGVLRERREQNRAGQTIIVTPEAETRFDAKTQLQMDPSVTMSGDQSGAMFSLPLFRGQDARSTHVYVDDVALLDPFSGLPMIDEIDLRAFGRMTVHKGFAPWNVPVMDPGGVIQFTTRSVNRLEGGASYGDVSGTSGWGQWAQSGDPSAGLDGRLYLRRSAARGHDRFYDDHGTVLNPSDDTISRRDNNDRQSHQALGQMRWKGDRWGVKGLIWGQQSEAGIAAGRAGADGHARIRSQTAVMTSSGRFAVSERVALGVQAGHFNAERRFKDPSNDVGFASSRRLRSLSTNLRLSAEGIDDRWRWLLTLDSAEASSHMTSAYGQDAYAPHAKQNKIFLGNQFKITSQDTIELKGDLDTSKVRAQNVEGSKRQNFTEKPASSGSVGWSHVDRQLWIYGQLGQYGRSPSLMERVGNGAEIEGAFALNPEVAKAGEVGARYQIALAPGLLLSGGGTFWGRDNDQVIRIDRVSATRWRAHNVGRQSYRGFEGRFELGSERNGLESAVSYLRARQVDSGRLVPRVPMWQAVIGPRWGMTDDVTVRALSHFIGRMYDDSGNTREIGWTLTHDLSVDWLPADKSWRVGLMMRNVTDVVAVPLRDVSTGQNDGKIAYSGFTGEPMTGRSWTASLSAYL
jgi:hypothetical protein